jgi:DNA-binding NtrC family response regulator
MRSTAPHSAQMNTLESGSAGRARVFVLEDDPGFRDVLVEFLVGEGLDVSICDTYASLCEAVKASPTAIVVADFWGASHRELSPVERAEIADLGSRAPTILLSGRAWAVAANAAELNVACILPKPPTLDDLLAQVRRCLALVSTGD